MLGGKNVSTRKWDKALKEADTNGDGKIDMYEFKSIFKQMIKESRTEL